ncbi:MAG: O-antigen ligase family protein [Pseudomonadota bacterium]
MPSFEWIVNSKVFQKACMLFPLAIVSLSFKQFKFGMTIGIFDMVAASLAFLIVLGSCRKTFLKSKNTLLVTTVFFAIFAGTIFEFIYNSNQLVTRDFLAFSFTFILMLAWICIPAEYSIYRNLAWSLIVYFSLILILSILPAFLGVDVWYYGVRLQGFSDNPNQIGFLCIVAYALLLHQILVKNIDTRLIFIANAIISLVGYLSGSTAFTISAIIGAILIMLHIVYLKWSYKNDASNRIRNIIAFVAPMLIIFFVILSNSIVKNVDWQNIDPPKWNEIFGTSDAPPPAVDTSTDKPSTTVKESIIPNWIDSDGKPSVELREFVEENVDDSTKQGSVRLSIWLRVLKKSLEKPVLGHGFGTLVAIEDYPHPTEAHNTVLDFALISGLLGVGAVGVLMILVTFQAYRNQHLFFAVFILGTLGSYAMFHFLGRQPLFWILIFLMPAIPILTPSTSRLAH